MSLIEVNGTALYYERRGDGPAILLVSGATGDAGHWTEVAEVLSSTYTVVTYDRRGNSRSPRPPGWTATTIDEQADDAEALISGSTWRLRSCWVRAPQLALSPTSPYATPRCCVE